MTDRFLVPADRRKQQKRLYGSAQWERVRRLVLDRDNHLCQIKLKACRVKANTVDHIVRPEEGGAPLDMDNLRASCRSCNMVRHNAAYFRAKVDAQAAGERNPYTGSPMVAPEASPARRVAYHHHHIRSSGDVLLYGYMTAGQETLDQCSDNCHLPRAEGSSCRSRKDRAVHAAPAVIMLAWPNRLPSSVVSASGLASATPTSRWPPK